MHASESVWSWIPSCAPWLEAAECCGAVHTMLPVALCALGLTTSVTSSATRKVATIYRDYPIDPTSLSTDNVRAAANRLEGVHADPERHPLAAKVLGRVPELASWEAWYEHPRILSNGHVHTIAAAKQRKTRSVKYYRELVKTPDGGTLAIDLLVGLRREKSANPTAAGIAESKRLDLSLFSGGAIVESAVVESVPNLKLS